MVGFVIFLVVILGIAGAVAPIVFTQVRSRQREQKNFERGLKMVPLLIHLPPPSDDTEGGGRDVRDVTDETISKATIIYNIIASTLQKGFKARFYGQRHFSFEIVGTQGFVFFYAIVPVALIEVVKQGVVSAYPAARMEEVTEPNIFNRAGKITGTAGGELNLKEPFAYPIATYQDLKRDALQSVLNSLSTLEKEDGAGIQILLRPADPTWRKTASSLASSKRKGEDNKNGFWKYLRQLLYALWQPPEAKKDGDSGPKPLSEIEQATLNSIDEKTRHPGYEIQIRIIASSNISQRAQAIVSNIVASFSLFDAPGKNGFKYAPAKDMESFATSYMMRFFQAAPKPNILNSVELASVFHFPDQKNIPTSQLTRQDSKQVDGPRNIPENGVLLGYNVFRGVKKPIRLDLLDRQRHMYVVGQTGVGKSVFLENLAFQDMLAGNGFAFVDPHGDTAEKLLSMVPKERTEDLIYFSPADMDFPMGLNLFEFNNPDQKDFLIQEALNMLYKLYDPQHQGIMGPRYEHLFRMAALTVMADPAGGTFIDIPKLFRDPKYVDQKLAYIKDQNVVEFWKKEMPQSQRSNDFGEVVSWFVSKFGAFLSNEMMRNIIGQNKSAFNLRDVMDNKKILLVNLSKGRLGDLNSKLLGMIFVMKFQAAAMSRADIPESERKDFSLYVDEFQNFSTDSFATIMSEARKYHLNLIVANQFTTQLTPEIRDAVFGNMGTIVSFRIGQNDVESITKYFQPTFDADDLLRVPNYNTVMRTLIGGVPTQPFSMATLPPLGNPNPKLAGALKQLSAAKYGRPRGSVEKDIFERMATKQTEPARPAFNPPAAGGFGAPSPFGPAGPAPARGGFGAPQSPVPGMQPMGMGAPAPAGNPWQPPVAQSPQMAPMPAPAPAPAPAPTQALAPAVSQIPAQAQAPSPAPTGTGSFLDEWLNKRQTQPRRMPSPAPAPANAPAPLPPSNTTPGQPPMSAQSNPSGVPALQPQPAGSLPARHNAPNDNKPSPTGGDIEVPHVIGHGQAALIDEHPASEAAEDKNQKTEDSGQEQTSGSPKPTSANDILRPSDKSLQPSTNNGGDTSTLASSDLQKSEINKIADEIEQSLKSQQSKSTASGDKTEAKPADDASQNTAVNAAGSAGGGDIKSVDEIDELLAEKTVKEPDADEIFIDPDGTLHVNNSDDE